MNMLTWPRLRLLTEIPYVALCLVLAGCISPPNTGGGLGNPVPFMEAGATTASNQTNMLSWIGGLSILGGIAALVITRGAMGTRALAVGVGLILLNYAVARYAHWIFVPVLLSTAAISLTYAFQIVRKAILKMRNDT